LVTSIVCVAVALAAEQQQPVFRAASDEVRVFATVTDRNGRLVANLKQEDFEVRDQGRRQPITLFDSTAQPIRLIVMLDVSGSMHHNLPLLREAGTHLFSRLRADDVARVGSFGKEIRISRTFTSNSREMAASLPDSIPSNAPTPLWEALHLALNSFGDAGDTRKVILVFTDGKDTVSASKPGDVIDRARREDVMIYAIWMRGLIPPPPPRNITQDPAQALLKPGAGEQATFAQTQEALPDPDLARVMETGGGYIQIETGQDLSAAFAAVADELHTQYMIGFAPPRRDGQVHKIDVRLRLGGMRARTRKSYVAPKG